MSPSSPDSTTIAGTVRVNSGSPAASALRSLDAAPGLTVSVTGTGLSAAVDSAGYFQLANVPRGTVRLQFKAAAIDATVDVPNVGQEPLIEIDVQISGTAAVIVNELRSNGKVSLCHRTNAGVYQLIDVSVSAEPAHRAHGDAKTGEPVPGQPLKVFDETCRLLGPSIEIEKLTNGQDADSAPGPTVAVGSTVSWQYVVTNTGTVPLTDVQVTDDKNVTVSCPKSSLTAGESMTCTGSGQAVAGQYRNVGTVAAKSASGDVTDTDPSHYFGEAEEEEDEGPQAGMVELCHRTGASFYVPIRISVNAEPGHRAHGDAAIGEAIPGMPGKIFGAGCRVP